MLLILILALLVGNLNGFSVTVKYKSEECFVVSSESADTVSGSFEVITGEPEQIIISVNGPPPINYLFYESKYKSGPDSENDLSEGEFSFVANKAGDYKLCIRSNDKIFKEETTVAFNFRTLSGEQQDYKYKGLESELVELKQGLDSLKDHESYMSQREDVHKETLDSINFKVICWSILEAIILIGMAAWQISYISNFFETKRKL